MSDTQATGTEPSAQNGTIPPEHKETAEEKKAAKQAKQAKDLADQTLNELRPMLLDELHESADKVLSQTQASIIAGLLAWSEKQKQWWEGVEERRVRFQAFSAGFSMYWMKTDGDVKLSIEGATAYVDAAVKVVKKSEAKALEVSVPKPSTPAPGVEASAEKAATEAPKT